MAAAPAQAHNAFTGSNPKNGARLAEAPESVTLSFLAKLDPATTEVTVTGPGGVAATDGEPGVKGNKVSVGVRAGAAGEYTVAYQIASSDGHPIKGKVRFTVATAAAAEVGATPAVAPTTTAPATTAPAITAPATTAPATSAPAPVALTPVAGGSDGTSWLPWLLGGVVLLVAAAVGGLLVRRRAAR